MGSEHHELALALKDFTLPGGLANHEESGLWRLRRKGDCWSIQRIIREQSPTINGKASWEQSCQAPKSRELSSSLTKKGMALVTCISLNSGEMAIANEIRRQPGNLNEVVGEAPIYYVHNPIHHGGCSRGVSIHLQHVTLMVIAISAHQVSKIVTWYQILRGYTIPG